MGGSDAYNEWVWVDENPLRKVTKPSVSRWRQLPAFQDALTAAEDPSYVDQDLNVVNLKWKGFDTLMSLLDDHNAAVRLRAAAEIFKLWGNRLPPYAGPDAEPE